MMNYSSVFDNFWSMFECADGDELKAAQSEDAYSFPECDYDVNPTALYKHIEMKNWVTVNQFLLTGYWSGAFFADPSTPKEQACTWVTQYDKTGKKKKVMWTHLPIHGALIHGAPEGVVQLLIKISPPSIRCADDQRMLPLHLAFQHGSSDTTLAMVLDVFPEGVAVRDFKGRTPADCAEDSPLSKRGRIIQTVLFHNQKAWEKKAAKAHDKQLASIREALENRNERVSHLESALDLVRCREDQVRGAFTAVVNEIKALKSCYEENIIELSDGTEEFMDARFVKELAGKLGLLVEFSFELDAQQTRAKNESDKTLAELRAVWNGHEYADVKFRNFKEEATHNTVEEDNRTEVSSRKPPDNDNRSEVSDAKLEVKSNRSEVSSRKPDVKDNQTEAGDNQTGDNQTEAEDNQTEAEDNQTEAEDNDQTEAEDNQTDVSSRKPEEPSDISSATSLDTRSSKKENKMEEKAVATEAEDKTEEIIPQKKEEETTTKKKQGGDMKDDLDADNLTIPSDFKDPESPAEEEAEEEAEEIDPSVAEDAPVPSVEVPMESMKEALEEGEEVGTIDRGSATNMSLGIEHNVSDMTSVDMWDDDSSRVSKGSSRLTSFRKRLKKITKMATKAASALEKKDLPPKDGKGKQKKLVKVSNLKVTPTL